MQAMEGSRPQTQHGKLQGPGSLLAIHPVPPVSAAQGPERGQQKVGGAPSKHGWRGWGGADRPGAVGPTPDPTKA